MKKFLVLASLLTIPFVPGAYLYSSLVNLSQPTGQVLGARILADSAYQSTKDKRNIFSLYTDPRFVSLKSSDTFSYVNQVVGDFGLPDKPVLTIVPHPSGRYINLSWQKFTKIPAKLILQRSNTQNSGLETVAEFSSEKNNLTALGFVDHQVKQGKSYYYKLTAVGESGLVVSSNLLASGVLKDSSVPESPLNLKVSLAKQGQFFQLDWQGSDSLEVSYYNIYRSTVLGELGSLLRTKIPVDHHQYLDKITDKRIVYYYVVTAVDHSGNESTTKVRQIETGNPQFLQLD